MNRTERIKELLRRTFQEPPDGPGLTEMDERILGDASTTMKRAVAASQQIHRISKWRRIMKTRTAKLTAAAVVLVAVFVITTWDRSTAWSFEQTIAAMKQLKNLQIKGKMNYWSEPVDFSCWIRCPGQESDLSAMRFECDKLTLTATVRDNVVHIYWPKENLVLISKQGSEINDLKFWYRAAQLSPWLTGKIVETLRLFTSDWNQVVKTDPVSGKEQVHVTCSYRPSNTAISFVVDTESKLIQRGKMWMNLQREGEPQFDGQTFIYNQEIPGEFFEFQMPAGVRVVTEKDIEENKALFKQAQDLFYNEKKYAEAIEVYRQVHDKFPHTNIAGEASMMVGLCHRRLGEHDKEIEAYQRTISEYSHAKGLGVVYFYLGRAYLEQGQKEKALEAFESCLAANEGVTEPDQFPLKDAREYIAKIKGE